MNAEREQMPPDHRTDPDQRDDAALATDRDDLDRTSTAPSVGDARDGTEMDETGDAIAGTATDETPARQPLLPEDRAGSYRERWEKIQVTFVDEPRTSVEEADRLVLDVIQ
ncbi:MAG TPA: hypothetical protein VLA90_02770, partial [Actinomycetota bacterium]|nr:hypothetical protein [Actinomycetota bacterium]